MWLYQAQYPWSRRAQFLRFAESNEFKVIVYNAVIDKDALRDALERILKLKALILMNAKKFWGFIEMQLRDYQQKFIDDIRHSFAEGNHCVCGVAPCGSGKTVIAA